MSLFKFRDWWTCQSCSTPESFDRGSLCVANIDNDPSTQDKILVGSLDGVLRIFSPSSHIHLPHDLLLELNLEYPILQIAFGRFGSTSEPLVGILHPHSFVTYTLRREDSGDASHGSVWTLPKICAVTLEAPSVNFTFGPFGKQSDKDTICVQSLDGLLTFISAGRIAFVRHFSQFLLPGPLCYVPSTDCLVTYSSATVLESYRYQTMAVMGTDSSAGPIEPLPEEGVGKPKPVSTESSRKLSSGGQKLQPNWSITLGQDIIDICTTEPPTPDHQPTKILVLGEQTLFILSDGGDMESQIPFDVPPSCCLPYGKQDGSNFLISTYANALMVFDGPKRVWAARSERVPIALQIGCFSKTPGFIVGLDKTGHLAVSYLGTRAASDALTADTTGSSGMTREEMDDEMRKLEERAKGGGGSGDAVVKRRSTEPSLNLSLTAVSDPDAVKFFPKADMIHAFDKTTPPILHRLQCVVTNLGPSAVRDVHVTFVTPPLVDLGKTYHPAAAQGI
ncbi:Protein PTHB1 [Borealophlyctis nickersoniae]|nr:Protein PTHB1 [Borealophlyctis nickersoniae]